MFTTINYDNNNNNNNHNKKRVKKKEQKPQQWAKIYGNKISFDFQGKYELNSKQIKNHWLWMDEWMNGFFFISKWDYDTGTMVFLAFMKITIQCYSMTWDGMAEHGIALHSGPSIISKCWLVLVVCGCGIKITLIMKTRRKQQSKQINAHWAFDNKHCHDVMDRQYREMVWFWFYF